MGKYLIVRGRGGRDAADGSSPLPKGKRILQHAIVVYLFNGRTELESFFIAIFLKAGEQCGFPFQHFQLEVLNPFAVLRSRHFPEERLVASVFRPVAERSYIRHGNIHVVRIERAVEQGSLSALADAGRNPFAGIDAFKGVADGVQVVCRILGGEVLPVFGLRGGFQEITVFHKNHVGIEQLGKFLAILGIEGIGGSIAFGYNHRGTVEADVGDNHALAETALFGTTVVQRLGKIGYILLGEPGGLQRTGFRNGGNPTQFLLQIGLCRGSSRNEQQGKQQERCIVVT